MPKSHIRAFEPTFLCRHDTLLSRHNSGNALWQQNLRHKHHKFTQAHRTAMNLMHNTEVPSDDSCPSELFVTAGQGRAGRSMWADWHGAVWPGAD